MPIQVFYILFLLVIICFLFVILKRPIYECMFWGYIFMILLTKEYRHFFTYIIKTSSDTLFFSIIAFLILAKILDSTHAIESIVNIILAILGRIPGGASYAAVISSTLMGALSGSGAGNVATTGTFTIPAMKRSNIPAHLAANIESASSTMGNMIPPAGIIVVALACYNEFSGAEMSQSAFWVSCWGIALWFILQRLITVFFFNKIYKVKALDASEIPNLRESLASGWKNLFLPVIILLPFIIDYFFKNTIISSRLGTGASYISSSLLLFTPGVAAIYALIINHKKTSIQNTIQTIQNSINGIIPVGATIFFAYCISNLFSATNVGGTIGEYIKRWNFSYTTLAFLIPFCTAILGMVLPGSAQTKIFGTTIITVFSAAGANPLLIAVMLPVITGAMEGITPPLALCTFAAMGIANASSKDTLINSLVWILLHYILSVVCLLGLLPILGL